MATYKIYRCINEKNGKVYIGYTQKTLEKRIIEHKCAANKNSGYLLHKSIRKYGIESFTWEIIFESKDKNYILNEMERFFIEEHNSFFENGVGYNMTYGGQGGMSGKKHSDEVKLKMKIARNSSEFRARNPNGIGLEKAIIKAAETNRGKPSWNRGKPQTWENAGKQYKGRSWIKDPITNKRVWI